MMREKEFFQSLTSIWSKSGKTLITIEMLREAARLAGPDISVQFEEPNYPHGSSNVLEYVVLFPEDCRLYLHIPTLRGSFIHDKELLYIDEYERIIPNINGRNRRNT